MTTTEHREERSGAARSRYAYKRANAGLRRERKDDRERRASAMAVEEFYRALALEER